MILIALFLALVATCATAQGFAARDLTSPNSQPSTPPGALRTLTTLREAHSLSDTEARRGYPVHVRAVVTYYDLHIDTRRVAFFLEDATGGIYAAADLGSKWPGRAPLPGTLVDVTGISAPGDFAPIIDQVHLTVLGNSRLPARAKPVTISHLLTGAEDGQWVEIEGVVHSVFESADNVTLKIAMAGGTVGAFAVKQAGVDYQHLVDLSVHIRGNAAPTFNSNRQLTGARLFFPGLETVSAVRPGELDAFSLPVQPVNSLLSFSPALTSPHRIHVRGTVALYWPGRTVCIKDDTEGLCAQTAQDTPLANGSRIDLAGFITLSGLRPALEDAVFRPIAGSGTVAALAVTPEQALQGNQEAELVQIDGRLIGRDLAASDTTLVLSSAGFVFRVAIPTSPLNVTLAAIPIGSQLRITGICSVQVDTQGTLKGYGITRASQFSILLRSPHDLVILQMPSLWTADRIRLVLLFTIAITLAAAIWVVVLRRRVDKQTREIRESRELYRHMAHHDSLTGLLSRALLHDHLRTALERCRRFEKGLALLMLDVDNFKRINDSFGHDCGDQVLRITAQRLSAIIRKTDSIARMGGDEFIVLLNDLANPRAAELVAAKVVATLSRPVRIGKIEVAVSVSVGVCTLSDATVDAAALLKRVDAAMYRAKAHGRGCFQVFTDDMIAHSGSPPSGAAASIAALNDQPETQIAPISDPVAL